MALTLRRYIEEFQKYNDEWAHAPRASHWGGTWVNRFVEAAKVSAYASGHLNCWLVTLNALAGLYYIAWGVKWTAIMFWQLCLRFL